ncbi:conserved hypothetical protein [Ricinus communis]|uniref:Uncharacterized protein n=1 Tax=Ricinus communis TaxID=3988 RepID=B9RZY8_RICCO|nr:conserved hypothetical protein [Ricinus communis]
MKAKDHISIEQYSFRESEDNDKGRKQFRTTMYKQENVPFEAFSFKLCKFKSTSRVYKKREEAHQLGRHHQTWSQLHQKKKKYHQLAISSIALYKKQLLFGL